MGSAVAQASLVAPLSKFIAEPLTRTGSVPLTQDKAHVVRAPGRRYNRREQLWCDWNDLHLARFALSDLEPAVLNVPPS